MKKYNKSNPSIFLGVLGCISMVATEATAGTPMMVNPAANARPGFPASGAVSRSGTNSMTVRLINSCYATNLRHVANPIAPSSVIEAKLELKSQKDKDSTPVPLNLMLKYPATVADKDGENQVQTGPVDPSMFSGPEGTTVRIAGNIVEAIIPMPVNVKVEGDGNVVGLSEIWPVTLSSYSFSQKVGSCDGPGVYGSIGMSRSNRAYPCQAYMGKDGPLSIKFEGVSIASDNSVVEIAVAFPGQTGFCGGWYSPLMLFFDDARPTFMGSSAFRLSAASHTYWVEAGAPGYFLAIDRNNNGKIDNKDELFGDLDNDKNGFDALKALDSNNDGVVNAKDKKNFKRLLLWQDKNGDGLSTKEELNSAKDFGVSEIELKHQRVLNSYGQTAAARQVGRFTFSKNNEFKTGKVEDIWLAPMNKEQPK